MPSTFLSLLSTLTLLGAKCLAAPLMAAPGTAQDIIITEDNTINGTSNQVPVMTGVAANPLQIAITNNMGASGSLSAYITGQNSNGAVVFLAPDGSWYFPDPDGSTSPIEVMADVALPLGGAGSTTTFQLPGYLSAARVWIAEGSLKFYSVSSHGTQLVEPSFANPADPSAAINWGFVELTYNAQGLWANLSFVDFVSLVLGMTLTLGSGEVQTRKGLVPGALEGICQDLAAQSAIDGQPWGDMCITNGDGSPLRIVSPNIYQEMQAGSFSTYFDQYIEDVWSTYSSENLTIDTQADPGLVNCRVEGGQNLFCDGDNRSYGKPSAQDIFGCNSGPFAILDGDNAIHKAVVPRLCAAFNRATYLEPGGDVQPSQNNTAYYQASPCNHYSRIVHSFEADGLGYAFAYDDVNPNGENQAGLVAGSDPTLLSIVLGGIS